jgi:hypothetical protein
MDRHFNVPSLSVCGLQIWCYAKKKSVLKNDTVMVGRYSRDSIMTRYVLVGLRIESCWKKDFIHLSRLALLQTQTSLQRVPSYYDR